MEPVMLKFVWTETLRSQGESLQATGLSSTGFSCLSVNRLHTRLGLITLEAWQWQRADRESQTLAVSEERRVEIE